MVRPGICIYGYYPNSRTRKEDALDLKPCLKFLARVTFIRDIAAGESISYVRAFTAEKPMRVATAGVGYSDGYPHQLAGKGFVLIRNKKFPVLPAVTANHVMIDLLGDKDVRLGDEVTLVDDQKGPGLTADSLAELAGIADYKLLIGVNPLLLRRTVSA
jgi:alanine racemase